MRTFEILGFELFWAMEGIFVWASSVVNSNLQIKLNHYEFDSKSTQTAD